MNIYTVLAVASQILAIIFGVLATNKKESDDNESAKTNTQAVIESNTKQTELLTTKIDSGNDKTQKSQEENTKKILNHLKSDNFDFKKEKSEIRIENAQSNNSSEDGVRIDASSNQSVFLKDIVVTNSGGAGIRINGAADQWPENKLTDALWSLNMAALQSELSSERKDSITKLHNLVRVQYSEAKLVLTSRIEDDIKQLIILSKNLASHFDVPNLKNAAEYVEREFQNEMNRK